MLALNPQELLAFGEGACLLAMVSVSVNEVCLGSNKVFQKICLSLMDRFFDRYTLYRAERELLPVEAPWPLLLP